MDSLELIHTFREVARRGSFSGAARAMDMSPANVSKYIVALETRFGVRLFHRTTRKVTLTDAGQLLYDRTGPVLELVRMTASDLAERATRPSGRIRMTAPHAPIHAGLSALIGGFLARYPEVSLDLDLGNRTVDLVNEGVDIALRMGPISEQNLIVRRLAKVERSVLATPAYWSAHGKPSHPRDLATHRTLVLSLSGAAPRWVFVEGGKPLEVSLQPLVVCNDMAPMPTLAMHDLGVIYVASASVRAELESGALEPVLQQFVPDNFWIYAAYTQRRHNSAALLALLDYLEAEFPKYTMPFIKPVGR